MMRDDKERRAEQIGRVSRIGYEGQERETDDDVKAKGESRENKRTRRERIGEEQIRRVRKDGRGENSRRKGHLPLHSPI